MRPARAAALLSSLLFSGLGLLPSPPAWAYVRARTSKGGTPLAWRGGCVFVTPDAAGTIDVAPGPDDEFAALARALGNWTTTASIDTGTAPDACSYLQLKLQPPLAGHEVGYDGINLIKYREQVWGRPEGSGQWLDYDPSAAALTTLFYVDKPGDPNDGQILDADTEVNAVDFRVEVDGATTQADARPLSDDENTLTHETGHLLGLDHTCWNGAGTQPLDDQGNPVPSCARMPLPPAVLDATMYAFAQPGETSKRHLTQDDIDGVCGVYPLARDPRSCAPVSLPSSGGGCSMSAGAPLELPAGSLALLLGALLGLAIFRGGRSRPPSLRHLPVDQRCGRTRDREFHGSE